jgi:hypothetical protein
MIDEKKKYTIVTIHSHKCNHAVCIEDSCSFGNVSLIVTVTFNLLNFYNGHFWNCLMSIWGYRVENLKLFSQPYRALSECTNVSDLLALYRVEKAKYF